jgi:hypothetical protein
MSFQKCLRQSGKFNCRAARLVRRVNAQVESQVSANGPTANGPKKENKKMEKREYTVYKFNELPKETQEKVVQKYWNINVDFDWSESTYEDAENIGLKIIGFDIDHGGYCKGNFIESARECADKIIKEHGEQCETHKTATEFLKERDQIIDCAERDDAGEFIDEGTIDNLLDCVEAQFLRDILEDYRIILQKEYDYQTSHEAIIETLEANDYDFTEAGEID